MQKRRKLLVIHRAIAPYRIDLFNALYEAFDAQIYIENQTPDEQKFDAGKLNERIRFKYSFLRKGLFGIKNLRLEVLSLIHKHRPDIILISEFNLITPIALMGRRLFAPHATIFSMCDDNFLQADAVIRGNSWKKRLMPRMSGIILCDHRAAVSYQAHFHRKGLFHTFPIIQDERYLRHKMKQMLPEAEKIKSLHPNQKIILYVGRLATVKNLDSLLRAYAMLPTKSYHLILVGNGPEEENLHQLTAELALAHRVSFAGKQEGDELLAYYAAADLFVLPSVYEPFGAVTHEALMAGLPVACSRVAGSTCLITPQNGRLFDPRNLQEIANTLTFVAQELTCADSHGGLKPARTDKPFEEEFAALARYLKS